MSGLNRLFFGARYSLVEMLLLPATADLADRMTTVWWTEIPLGLLLWCVVVAICSAARAGSGAAA